MKKYNISGMSCAACSARVERAVSSVAGVSSCSVNLLTNSMTTEGGEESDIIAAVKAAGYGASPANSKSKASGGEEDGSGSEIRTLVIRLVSSAVILLLLMYISMGHMMWGFPLPSALAANPAALGLCELLLAAAVMIINQKFFISGTRAIFKGSPNMDTLVSLGSSVSFMWSVYVLFLVLFEKNHEAQHEYLHELYFESAAMIVALITLGKLLEAIAKGKTTSAIKSLMALTPKEAHVIRDGVEITVPSSEVRIGDIFAVRPGESFPVDGVVISGESGADEASLTGESMPVEKAEGSSVYASTINLTGYLECRAVKVGEDTVMGEVVKMVSDAASGKAPIAKLADRVSGIFVPVVLGIALLTSVIWLIINGDIAFALARGISVLVISCPCALGLATPVAIMVGSGIGARGGVLFKTATAIELAGRAKTVLLDKTGTITAGEAVVTDVIPRSVSESELLSLAAAAESRSEHPLARAICRHAEECRVEIPDAESFSALVGSGVSARIGGDEIYGGSYKFISDKISVSDDISELYTSLADEGKTPVFFTRGSSLLGVIAIADSVREDSAEAVAAMRRMGMRVVMLTGDNEKTAAAIAKRVGIDEVRASVLPADKANIAAEFSHLGKTVMVGDGINDAPALTAADVGIAIGRGTDIAIESADVVLMRDSLSGVVGALKLGRATLTNIKENLFWAFFYNAVCIPTAAGVFVSIGFTLSPMLGALAMSLSSFTVVMNALRLNLQRIFSKKSTNENNPCAVSAEHEEKEDKKMIELTVKGMMCPHCEARVKSVLEAIDGVVSAEVSHEAKSARVTLSRDVDASVLADAVKAAGYECSPAN